MKQMFSILVLLVFILTLISPILAATIQQQVEKLENEVAILQGKLAKTKSKTQISRLKTTIRGHQAKIVEFKKDPSYKALKLEITKVEIVEQPAAKILAVKGGLAGGAALIGVNYLMPVGPVFVGGEAGYAIGAGFGIINLGAKAIYSLGDPFVGLELSYAGYSKDVTAVAGLSGVIKSGIGIGIIGGTTFGPIEVSAGYNTILGLRADAGYRIYL